jgi:acyl carrier protein
MTLEELSRIVYEVKPSLAGQTLTLNDSLPYDLGLDSLDLLQLGRRVQRVSGTSFLAQDWMAAEQARPGKQFTIDSMLKAVNSLGKST